MATIEPERIRWVRYAADCAERVLHLTGAARPQAEAAIQAARAWADEPTDGRRVVAMLAADAADELAYEASDAGFEVRADAIWGAAEAAFAASAHGFSMAVSAAKYAADSARAVHYLDSIEFGAYEAAREWQAERRKFYRLPGG